MLILLWREIWSRIYLFFLLKVTSMSFHVKDFKGVGNLWHLYNFYYRQKEISLNEKYLWFVFKRRYRNSDIMILFVSEWKYDVSLKVEKWSAFVLYNLTQTHVHLWLIFLDWKHFNLHWKYKTFCSIHLYLQWKIFLLLLIIFFMLFKSKFVILVRKTYFSIQVPLFSTNYYFLMEHLHRI